MSENTNPARYWRNLIRSELRRYAPPAGIENETHFREYVRHEYRREKENLVQLQTESNSEDETAGTRLAIYFLAIVLFTYGDLDALEDILNYVPGAQNPARVLARSVHSLLPLRENDDVLARPQDVSNWVRTHRSRLTWDEDLGRFTLDDENLT